MKAPEKGLTADEQYALIQESIEFKMWKNIPKA